jgi:hypothetical protein
MKKKKKLYGIEGKIHSTVYYFDMEKPNDKKILFETKKIKLSKKIIKPVYEQKLNESRRNWHKVTVHLQNKEFEKATDEKTIVEERERKTRKEREENNVSWNPVYFDKVDKDWIFKNSSL